MAICSDLVIIGARGYRELSSIVRDINFEAQRYTVVGVLDDAADLAGADLGRAKVAGALNDAIRFTGCRFVLGIGSHRNYLSRRAIIERIGIELRHYESLVHPTAVIYDGARFGRGCVMHPYSVIFNGADIGDFTVINPFVNIGEHNKIGEGCLIAAQANLTSGVVIEPYCHIGAGALVSEGVRIGCGAQVGLGSLVTADVPAGALVLGAPARVIRIRKVPAEVLARAEMMARQGES